ncbi:YceI family protein [Rhodohalobacter sp. 614A]|uniref:YceI family protein n=1 Tax=Rhodohalobacter sp. 614A TaxID=2908649 RepID=UPI001F3D141D|nr:YceI family protein [Rhodohalobacter sp. 614A]
MYTQKIISLFIALLFMAGSAVAQDITLTAQESSSMIIDGDSNVHDWEAQATEVNGTLVLQNIESVSAENLTPESFKSLSLTIPVEGIDAESGGLKKNIHKHMEKDDYPNVTFELNNVTEVTSQDGALLITGNGVITAKGTSYTADMQVTANVQDGSIQFTGEKQILMTDFGIDPPTAVFGTIRSKDEVIIKFDVSFSR